MPRKRSLMATLKRIERVRAVEQFRARAEMAEAHHETQRLALLAQRSRAMMPQYAGQTGMTDARSLSHAAAFQNEIGQLAQSAEDLGKEASARSDKASADAASAEHRLKHIRTRYKAEKMAAENAASELSNQTPADGKLARRLQGKKQ